MRRFHFLHREPFLLAALILVIAAFFAVTTFAAHAYHRKQERFADGWYQRGEEALRQARPAEAVDDFRNALAYARDNDLYRLRLAQALLADKRPKEARAHLLSLWEKEPGDGLLNLELARMAAMWGDTRQAVRYYHAAIYGVWLDDPNAHRIEARFELADYLLKRNAVNDAQAELVALAAGLQRDDVPHQTRLGNMMLQTGLNARALLAFRNVLETQPNSLPALAGVGEAAFRMGNYPMARHYLLPLATETPENKHATELLNLSELALKLDPFERGLRSNERARRVVHDFQVALARAHRCSASASAPSPPSGAIANAGPPSAGAKSATAPSGAPTPPADDLPTLLQQAVAMRASIGGRVLATNPDVMDRTMELVFKLEKAMGDAQCGSPTPEDKVLVLLARKPESSQ